MGGSILEAFCDSGALFELMLATWVLALLELEPTDPPV
jgi:hypothetical protein